MPTTYTSDDVTPAMRYYLLVGVWAPGRVKGWVALAQAGMFRQPTAADVWEVHRDALIAEAAAAGFRPFWATRKRPTGARFARWRERFLEEHSY